MKTMMNTKPARKGLTFRPRVLVFLFIIFGFLLVFYSVFDLKASKREQIHVMNEQAVAMMKSMQKSTDNALRSFDLLEDLLAEKLLSMGRLLQELDAREKLTEADIVRVAQENKVFRINVFDKQGVRQMSNIQRGQGEAQGLGQGMGRGPGQGAGRNFQENQRMLDLLADPDVDELVMGFKQSRFGTGSRFAVAIERQKGGAIVLNIDAQEMLNFRKTIGIGKLIRDVGDSEGIEYVVIQDSTGILLASAHVDSMTALQDDPFMLSVIHSEKPQTRFTQYGQKRIYEVVQAQARGQSMIMRIGLSTSHLQEAESSTRARVVIASILFLVVGVLATNWVVSNQNYTLLQDAYEKIESYTGSILTNMDEAVIAVNQASDITLVNKAAEKLFEFTAQNVLEKPCGQKIPWLCDYFEKVMKSKNDTYFSSLDIEINGRQKVVSMSVNIVPDEKQDKDIVFAVIRDMTRQRQLEANLARKDKITAMGHLASGVAHEIRNPLNAISMIAQRFKSEFRPTEDVAEYEKLSVTMVDESRRINDIVQQFLRFARPPKLSLQNVSLADLFSTIATLTGPDAKNNGVTLDIGPADSLEVNADADKLKQVLLNLVNNAIQACGKNDLVAVSANDTGDQIQIVVSDTGRGIAPEHLDKVFNMYFTTRQEGTGLGLSIVQQIISQHNGTIDVSSIPESGTTFIIQLPKGV